MSAPASLKLDQLLKELPPWLAYYYADMVKHRNHPRPRGPSDNTMLCACCYDANLWTTTKATPIDGFYKAQNNSQIERVVFFLCAKCVALWKTRRLRPLGASDCRIFRFLYSTKCSPSTLTLSNYGKATCEEMRRKSPFYSVRDVYCANTTCGARELQDDPFLCCGRCMLECNRRVYYCRVACQRQHYKAHWADGCWFAARRQRHRIATSLASRLRCAAYLLPDSELD